MNTEKNIRGITAEKDDFSEWFTQLMIKADLADYTKVSGCIVFKPTSWALWENVRSLVDERLKKLGVENVNFPLFIPESLLVKEQEHVEGFTPEVAWVTHTGETKLNERLAVRPTSEAIMYDSFSQWIRSWRDLPRLYNQWGNVVRWEFKHPTPFLRTREFSWNEGHSVHATRKEAEAEKTKILNLYKEVCEQYMALPGLTGRKTNKEKFAGAEYTYSMEYYMPNGKAIQGPDFHFDGQNFAKAYDITFLDEKEQKQYVWQNTYAISTRMLGVMFAVHSDDKGLIIPPNIARKKMVIVPIFTKENKEEVLTHVHDIQKKLAKHGAFVDARDNYKPGVKFNEWELKGIPLRIEIGQKDITKKQVVIVRRDTQEKKEVLLTNLVKEIQKIADDIQNNLYERAKKLLYDNLSQADDYETLTKHLKEKKLVLTPLCASPTCEETLKEKTGGAKTLNIPDAQPTGNKPCVICGDKQDYYVYIGKSY